MDANDFRRIALSLEGAEEGAHFGQADFRVGGRIFATLAAEKQGLRQPDAHAGAAGWVCCGRAGDFSADSGGMGAQRRDACAVWLLPMKTCCSGALRAAWKLRVERNQKVGKLGCPPLNAKGAFRMGHLAGWGFVGSHPSRKNKDAARMGHPRFGVNALRKDAGPASPSHFSGFSGSQSVGWMTDRQRLPKNN